MMIYFNLHSEDLEKMSDDELLDIFNSLSKYGELIFQPAIPNCSERIQNLYKNRETTVKTLRGWIRDGFLPSSFSEDFLDTQAENKILSNESFKPLFRDDSNTGNIDYSIIEVIRDNIDFYKSHYKEASLSSYWRNL